MTYQMAKSKHNRAEPHVHTTTACLHNRAVAIYIVRYSSWLHFFPNSMLKSAVNSQNQQYLLWRKTYVWAKELHGNYDVICYERHYGIVTNIPPHSLLFGQKDQPESTCRSPKSQSALGYCSIKNTFEILEKLRKNRRKQLFSMQFSVNPSGENKSVW